MEQSARPRALVALLAAVAVAASVLLALPASADEPAGAAPTSTPTSSAPPAPTPSAFAVTEPTVAGSTAVGATLTALAGVWRPRATLSFQWLRDGVPVPGATRATYLLTAADAGKRIAVTTTGSASGYATTSVTSTASAAVLDAFAKAPAPRTIGPVAAGGLLRAVVGTWSPAPTLTYQWMRDGKAVPGATAPTYRLTGGDVGARITLSVTARRTGVATTTKTSTPTGAVRAPLAVSDPASIAVLVNKATPLTPRNFAATGLVRPQVRGGGWSLRKDAATALAKLAAASRAAGAGDLGIASGHRSYGAQQGIFNGYVASRGRAAAEKTSARPGYSEHQTGLAADVVACGARSCGSMSAFGSSRQGAWVAANAWRYGFIVRYEKGQTAITGYSPEPWHLRYIGTTLAAEYHAGGFHSLEKFYGYPAAPGYR